MKRKKSKLRRWVERLFTKVVTAAFSGLVWLLPLSALHRIAEGVAWLIRLLAPSRQRVAVDNMQRALGDRCSEKEYRAIAAQVTRNICRTMVELLKLPHLSSAQVKSLMPLEGGEYMRAGLDRGRGVIILTAHYGNWELMGARLVAEGFPVTVIARDAPDPFTASVINRSRRSRGMEVLDRESLRAMLQVLHSNGCLGILPDQHAAGGGIIIDFLGRPAATAVGVATLALRTGCAVVPVFSCRHPDGSLTARAFPALKLVNTGDREADVRANTILCNEVIGQQIREHPEQWLWLHRRWKVDGAAPGAPGRNE